MEDGRIQDSQLTASSYYGDAVAPSNARLNHGAGSGDAWHQSEFSMNEWLQVDLGVTTAVTGLVLQGRDRAMDWNFQCVTKYRVQYSDGATAWLWIRDVNQQEAKVKLAIFSRL